MRLDTLQEVVDHLVRVSIVIVCHSCALAKERVGLIEEQLSAGARGVFEDGVEVLLGLADVLAHDAAEIDRQYLRAGVPGKQLGRLRFARAAHAEQQAAHAPSLLRERDEVRDRFRGGRWQVVRHFGSANATVALPEGAPFLPPPQAMTTYWRP